MEELILVCSRLNKECNGLKLFGGNEVKKKNLKLTYSIFVVVGLKGFSLANGSSNIGIKNPVPMLRIVSGVTGHGDYLISNTYKQKDLSCHPSSTTFDEQN